MCLRYEKIICYDWIIQRLLELFVCTDFIFIVILTSSTIYFCSIFRYLLAIINIYTHTFKYLSINIYKYLYFWRNSQIHIFVSVCCVCRGQLNVCLSKSYKAHSTEQHPPPSTPLPWHSARNQDSENWELFTFQPRKNSTWSLKLVKKCVFKDTSRYKSYIFRSTR